MRDGRGLSTTAEPPASSGRRIRLLITYRFEAERSPTMRARRAKPKSRRDDMIVAQGKRSAALGCGPKIIFSLFPSGLARLRRAKPEGKREVGWVGSLPRAAASAALPLATIVLPLRGAGKANKSPPNQAD